MKVKPNSSKQEIINCSEGKYVAYLKSAPENNKANIELIKLISKELNIPSSNIKIKFGKSSHNKIIEIK